MSIPRTDTPLAELLYARRLTQTDLVTMSGVSRTTVWRAVYGKEIGIEVWIKLAAALNVSVGDIAPAAVAAQIALVS